MIAYIKYGTILPCALVLILVTYEFATEKSLCCKSLSSNQTLDTDIVYSHRGILKALAMGVTNLCIMGKGKFGVDENFYKVSSSFIFLIYMIGMSVSVWMYSQLLSAYPAKQLKVEIVATFASCVILSGLINLVLVWSQMMCLCVCHEKYVRKSIRLAKCVCKCKDKADLNFFTLRKTKKSPRKSQSLSKDKTNEEKQDNILLSQPDLQEKNKIDVTDSNEKTEKEDIELEVQIEAHDPDSEIGNEISQNNIIK